MIYLTRINELADQPEFYHLLSNSCTINIIRYANAAGRSGRFDIRHLLNGLIDSYLYHSGRVDTTLPFDELRRRSLINEAAQAADGAADFWQRIRASLPTVSRCRDSSNNSRRYSPHRCNYCCRSADAVQLSRMTLRLRVTAANERACSRHNRSIFLPARPERHADADHKGSGEDDEEHGLFYPGTVGTASARTSPRKHSSSEARFEPGQKRAERQQHQQDQTGGRRRQQLLNASQQHDVHGNEYGNPV